MTAADDALFADAEDALFDGDEDDRPDAPYAGTAGRGRYGRYRRPHPETGKISDFPRVSTVAETVQSTFALDRWQRRNLAFGLADRPDLIDLLHVTDRSDGQAIDRIIERAQDSAGAKMGADKGTTLHGFADRVDRGLALPKAIRAAHRRDMDAYTSALYKYGIDILPDCIERVICVPEIDVMGRFDRAVTIGAEWLGLPGNDRIPVISDLKTSQHSPLKFSAVSVVAQLAMYSRAKFFELPPFGSGKWEPVPLPLSQEHGLIVELPQGSGECRIWRVDLMVGWELVKIALRLRELNSAAGKRRLIQLL